MKRALSKAAASGVDSRPGPGASRSQVMADFFHQRSLLVLAGLSLRRWRSAVIVLLLTAGAAADSGEPGSETWWAFEPLRSPALPAVAPSGSGISNPIDLFLRARLAERGLEPAPEADRRTLIRRLSFDLIGLPPRPEEVEAFLADSAPLAHERL